MKNYTIQEIIQITNVSKRTLHYYDNIDLLKPNKNKDNGYREYSHDNLIKLQKILFFKNVGLSLKEVTEIIDLDDLEQKLVLEKHKVTLEEKIENLKDTLEKLESIINGSTLEEEIFQKDNFIKNQYKKEANIKYKDTQEYNYFENYNKANNFNNKELQNYIDTIYRNLYSKIGIPVSNSEVQFEINNLYSKFKEIMNCSKEVFYYICLGYVEDERFNSYFKKFGDKNLPKFILEAVEYYLHKNK